MKAKDIQLAVAANPQTVFKIESGNWYVRYGIITQITNSHVRYQNVVFKCTDKDSATYSVELSDTAIRVPLNQVSCAIARDLDEAAVWMHDLDMKHREANAAQARYLEAQEQKRKESKVICDQITEALDIDPYFGFVTRDGTIRLDLNPDSARRLLAALTKQAVSA
jgi:hypothetical protein